MHSYSDQGERQHQHGTNKLFFYSLKDCSSGQPLLLPLTTILNREEQQSGKYEMELVQYILQHGNYFHPLL